MNLIFEPLGTGNQGRLQISTIYLNGKEIGQERVYLPKPFTLDDKGHLVPGKPKYQYLDWNSCVKWDDKLPVECDSPLEVSPDDDEWETGFRCPGWSTIEKFEEHLNKKS